MKKNDTSEDQQRYKGKTTITGTAEQKHDIENHPKQTNEIPPMLSSASDTSNVSMQRNDFVTTKTITSTILYDERRKRTKNVTLILCYLR